MRNFAFAKYGKSIKFKAAHSPIGGDNEPVAMLKALANNNPDDKYYIIGRSDFGKLSENEIIDLFPYNNVIDAWENVMSVPYMKMLASTINLHKLERSKTEKFLSYLVDYFNTNNIKIDYAIIMMGQVAGVTIPHVTTQINDTSKIAAVIDMTFNYTSPISILLNETNIPWVEIITDPRYNSSQPRDLMNVPKYSLSQFNTSYDKSNISSYEDQRTITTKVDITYDGVETVFCVGRERPNLVELGKQKTEDFMIVLNEGKPSRYNELKRWVLDYNEDVSVYGKWDRPETKKDERFVGSLYLTEIQEKLKKVKYTFIIPIAPGWVTAKYIEMIHAGVIPFFHPTYDTQHSLDVPEFLRISTPKELYDKIHYLNDNEDAYFDLLKQLQEVLREDYYNGKFLSNRIMSKLYSDYEEPDLTLFKKNEINSLEGFFA